MTRVTGPVDAVELTSARLVTKFTHSRRASRGVRFQPLGWLPVRHDDDGSTSGAVAGGHQCWAKWSCDCMHPPFAEQVGAFLGADLQRRAAGMERGAQGRGSCGLNTPMTRSF
jgi:hypothetical protein